MRAAIASFILALVCTPLIAQVPAPAATPPASTTFTNPLGFSYAMPADWDVVDSQTSSKQAKDNATQSANSAAEKKGVACTQIGFTARHGNPTSVIVEVALPFDCYGQQFAQDDLPGFGTGAAEGIKQNFDIGNPQAATYALGTHHLWAERVLGTPKGQPDKHYTIEISCALLSKAAVCWLTMAADSASLAVFESGAVTLDDGPAVELVPTGTFKH
jgi:hypothetical protein